MFFYYIFVFLVLNKVFGGVEELHNEVIGFTAWKQNSQAYVSGDTIVFEGVEINEGNFYTPDQGHFLCPVTGVYFINLNVKRNEEFGNVDNSLRVMKGTDTVLTIDDHDGDNDYNTASNSAVIRCEKDVFITVKAIGVGNIYGALAMKISTFTVFLVAADSTNTTVLGRPNAGDRYHDEGTFQGFSAVLPYVTDYLRYDVLILNETVHSSSDYDNTTGVYTCSRNGFYYVAVHVGRVEDQRLSVGLNKGTLTILHLEDTVLSYNDNNIVSNSRLLSCAGGEQLSLKGTGVGSARNTFTTFTVMMINGQVFPNAEKYHDSFTGFSVFKTSNQQYSDGDRITFEGIMLNEGAAYRPESNSFVCPDYAIYYVSVNFHKVMNVSLDVEVMLDSVTLLKSLDLHSGNVANTISNGALIRCLAEQEVYVKGVNDGAVFGEPSKALTTFSIMKIMSLSQPPLKLN